MKLNTKLTFKENIEELLSELTNSDLNVLKDMVEFELRLSDTAIKEGVEEDTIECKNCKKFFTDSSSKDFENFCSSECEVEHQVCKAEDQLEI